MKYIGLLLVGMGLVTTNLHASVTPSYLALKQIRAFLEPQLIAEIFNTIPPYKATSHLVGLELNLMRGKYSTDPGGFAQFFGHTNATIQIGLGDQYHIVECNLSAHTRVVPFAKQMFPILEEEVNNEQLILEKHKISCRLQQ